MEHLSEFSGDNAIEVIAYLPFNLENDVDRVRGQGTFQKCVEALKKLNSLGYGARGSEKELHLVYNSSGAFMSQPQESLENEYRKRLFRNFGITFERLYTFINMPIGRLRDYLIRSGNCERYMEKLTSAFNPETLDGLMCRHLINVGWNGTLYDCDF